MSNGGPENQFFGTVQAGEQEQTEGTEDRTSLKISIPTNSSSIATESFLLLCPASSDRACFEARFYVQCLEHLPSVATWTKEGVPWNTRLGFEHLVHFVGPCLTPPHFPSSLAERRKRTAPINLLAEVNRRIFVRL